MIDRERLWLDIAELWLDTEQDEAALRHLAAVLRASGLSREELNAIYLFEVAPVVWPNCWSVAGVWSGFEPSWLIAQCRRNQQRGGWHRLKCRLLRWPMTYANREDWQRVMHML